MIYTTKMLFPSSKIYTAASIVVPSERGVFAKDAMQKGESIERCPILAISPEDTQEIAEESLVSYMFYFGEKKEQALIALGFGSLYNHTDEPNAAYEIKPEENIIEFTAIKDIQKDEEITVNYAKESSGKLWFEK